MIKANLRLLGICIAFLISSLVNAQNPERPNIVIILVDDMGFSDIGCYGSEIETPNIDKLASGGLRFTQFYNSGRCCPTRASLMTGLQPHQVGIGHMTEPPKQPLGIKGPYQGYLNKDCVTLAQVLKPAGYHTLMVGKWHLGLHSKENWPLQRGFDKYYGCLSGAINYFKPGGGRFIYDGNQQVDTDENFYATDNFTDKAIEYISEVSKKDDHPFFLYVAYNAPHWPLNAKLEDYKKYRGKYKEGWEVLRDRRLKRQKELGLFEGEVTPTPLVTPDWKSLPEKKRDDLDAIMAAYAGCVDSIDQNIGKLTQHLKKLGKLDNTLIFFLSDNGACQEGGKFGKGNDAMVRNPPLETTGGVWLGLNWANATNTPFRLYKHFVHEGGACTPMVVHWPKGIPQKLNGSFIRNFAYLPDFMPTCLELSGAQYPKDKPVSPGRSMLPLLKGSPSPIHPEPIYWEHEGNAALRWGDWKLVKEYKKPWELYNLKKDRTELNNLSKSHPEKYAQLITLWEAWATEKRVAYPERFNMYEFLRKKRQREQVKKEKPRN